MNVISVCVLREMCHHCCCCYSIIFFFARRIENAQIQSENIKREVYLVLFQLSSQSEVGHTHTRTHHQCDTQTCNTNLSHSPRSPHEVRERETRQS